MRSENIRVVIKWLPGIIKQRKRELNEKCVIELVVESALATNIIFSPFIYDISNLLCNLARWGHSHKFCTLVKVHDNLGHN